MGLRELRNDMGSKPSCGEEYRNMFQLSHHRFPHFSTLFEKPELWSLTLSPLFPVCCSGKGLG